jgi:hypothetical protein
MNGRGGRWQQQCARAARAALLAAVWLSGAAMAAGCKQKPPESSGTYSGSRITMLMLNTGSQSMSDNTSVMAQVDRRTLTLDMGDCVFDAHYDGDGMFSASDIICTLDLGGEMVDILGDGTVIALGDGNLSIDLSGTAAVGATGGSGTFTLTFDGTIL